MTPEMNYYWKNKDKISRKKSLKKLFETQEQRTKRLQKRRESRKLKPDYDRSRARKRDLLIKFGLTLEDYNSLLMRQEHSCAICKRHKSQFKRDLSVDHCHKTGKNRALLCASCNSALGLFQEDKEVLLNAINYLEKYNALTVRSAHGLLQVPSAPSEPGPDAKDDAPTRSGGNDTGSVQSEGGDSHSQGSSEL